MEIYVIYENPSDYPGQFVVRRWRIIDPIRVDLLKHRLILPVLQPDQHPVAVADSLEKVRSKIPHSCTRTAPHPEDDPVILEVWL